MTESIFYIIGGLIALSLGAELLIAGAKSIGFFFRLSPAVIGLTIVAAGTSLPEFLISLKAALVGNSAISLGNVIGSNICNILFVMGAFAVITPIPVHRSVIKRDWPILFVVSLVLFLQLHNLSYSRLDASVSLILFLLFTFYVIKTSGKDSPEVDEEKVSGKAGLIGLLKVAIGCIFLHFGSDFFLEGAVALAKIFSVPDRIIGLTIVSIGTSLPELFASVVAALRKQTEIALGNVIGSNIQNTLLILGGVGSIQPFDFSPDFLQDYWIMLGATLILFATLRIKFTVSRLDGFFVLSLFAAYITFLIYSK